MKTYIVGGAVRDRLLGLPDVDRDHVVVGGTPEEMVARGFRPVGKDFPVFLHPQTQEEYALARTERKSGRGYKGFHFHYAPDVTLEEDLRRRDLTINAMALDEETGALIDPYGGRRDLDARIMRHVSEAFAEDPVRLLRVARFAARFGEFTLAPETSLLLKKLVAEGEVDALVPERVWQELARGLMEKEPSRMLRVLFDCGALVRLLPGLRDDPAVSRALDEAARHGVDLPQRFALWMQAADEVDAAVARLRVPVDCADAARLLAALRPVWRGTPDPEAMVAALERGDGFRKPERYRALLGVAALLDGSAVAAARWRRALEAARAVDAGAIARTQVDAGAIKAAVHRARVEAVRGSASE